MKFTKNVVFLGYQANALSDGTAYFTLNFFSKEDGPISVNVMGTHPIMNTIPNCDFGDVLEVTFILKPKDKLYKLGIA